jgi:hypothetical protein
MKTHPTPKTKSPGPAALALSKLEGKLIPIRNELGDIAREQAIAFARYGSDATSTPPMRDHAQAALALLNGSAEGRMAIPKKADLGARRAVLEKAIEIGNGLYESLRVQVRAELAEQRLPEFEELMRQKAQLLVGLEEVEIELDAVTRGTALVNYAMPELGRVRNTASRIYVALEQLSKRGFVGAKEFAALYAKARKAADWN